MIGIANVKRNRILDPVGHDWRQPVVYLLERIVPGDRVPLVPFSDLWLRDAVGISLQLSKGRAFRAKKSSTQHIVPISADPDDGAPFKGQFEATCGLAERARPKNCAPIRSLRHPIMGSSRSARYKLRRAWSGRDNGSSNADNLVGIVCRTRSDSILEAIFMNSKIGGSDIQKVASPLAVRICTNSTKVPPQ